MTRPPQSSPIHRPPGRSVGQPARLGRRRHPHHHQAQPDRLHPHPRVPVLLHRAADHVRAAVPLRLRRGHPRPAAGQLRRLPDGRDLRPERRPSAPSAPPSVWPRTYRRAHRALPGPAHGPLGRPRRTHHGRSGPQHLRGPASSPAWARRGIQLPHRRRCLHRRHLPWSCSSPTPCCGASPSSACPPPTARRPRSWPSRSCSRWSSPRPPSSGVDTCPVGCGPSPPPTRRCGGRGHPGPVDRRGRGGRPSQYVPQALAWCFGLLAVLVPVAVWRYRQSTS